MDGKTRVVGVIGDPIEHTMSPLMHNIFAQRTGKNLVYVPFRVKRQDLKEAVAGARALNLLGLNVTVPHKQEMLNCLAEVDQAARVIGAVNTLVNTGDGYKGYNSDAPGLKRALKKAGISVTGRKCLLLGAGGAALAAACVLEEEQAGEVWILNRSLEKAQKLADDMNRLAGRSFMRAMELSDYGSLPGQGREYVAIQCTSVGMYPHVEQAILEDPEFYSRIDQAFDVVYTPSRTRFMELVEQAGGRAVNGLDMLLYQGIISYELWNPDVQVDEETEGLARQAILEELERRRRNHLVLIGFMGAGKTSVAEELNRTFQMPVIDTDQRIEALAGMEIREIFATQGEEAFRRLETQMLEELLKEPAGQVISVGGGLPMGEENQRLLRQLGTVVLLDVSEDTVLQRLGEDVSSRPMLRGTDVRSRIQELMAIRRPVYRRVAHEIIDVNGKTLKEIAGQVHKIVE